jgi:stearoyl-CoA desaturase (Delta-9 desaturase)
MAQGTVDTASTERIRGIVTLDESAAALQRRVTLALTILPFAGFVAAVVSLWGRGLGASDAIAFVTMYVVTGLGVTVGFHRLLTHRSFEAPGWTRALLAAAGSMAVQGSVISWVAAHRRHHAFADKEGDPHSPHLEADEGITGVLKGLWHAHIGWLFDEHKTSQERWAPDLLKERSVVVIDRLFPALVVATFVFPAVIGWALTGTLAGAFTAFLWGGLARVFLLHHVTWSVNSICHFYGRQPFETKDHSTNNWPLALISLGESWHNNHHAFPTAAVHGLGRFQVDISGLVISAMERLHVARRVKRVAPKQLAEKTKEGDL